MLTALAAFALITVTPQDQAPAQAGLANAADCKALISKMLKVYADANTMVGSITLTGYAGGGQSSMTTYLQFEKPAKLFIRQDKGGSEPRRWIVSSDGRFFSYESPNQNVGVVQRLIEPITSRNGTYDFKRIYSVAARDSIGDRSVPLDIAISRHEDLEHDVMMWATFSPNGRVKLGDMTANSIIGHWRPYGEADIGGKYELVIADDGRLLRYTLEQLLAPDPNMQPQQVRFVWEVNLQVNAKPDPKYFVLVR